MEKMQERNLRWYDYVICANRNSLSKIRLNNEVDGKRPKRRPAKITVAMQISKPRDGILIKLLTEQNGEIDHGVPTQHLNGTKAKEEDNLIEKKALSSPFPSWC